jgi:uncharacterized damage-inducible protein DinB
MELKTYFLAQLESEVAASRKAIERVPEGRNDWKPHPKSMELGYLAALVASMPGWAEFMIDRDELDLQAPANAGFKTKAVGTRAELLRLLDEGSAKSRKALHNTTEEHLMKPWRLVMFGQVMTEGPRYLMLMNGMFSHRAHHRGQLTVYLRLNEAAVPAMYGPSADERG